MVKKGSNRKKNGLSWPFFAFFAPKGPVSGTDRPPGRPCRIAMLRSRMPSSAGLGGGFFAQFAAQDLAHVALGQFVAEFHVARLLVAGEVLARVRLDLLGRQRRLLLADDQLDRLAGLLVRYAVARNLEHADHHRDDGLAPVGTPVEPHHQARTKAT